MIGSLYAVFQLVNIVGETIMDFRSSRVITSSPSEDGIPPEDTSESKKKGFISSLQSKFLNGYQLIHGWNETLIAVLCEDIPQIIILVAFSFQCSVDWNKLLFTGLWYILKNTKNSTRMDTCKHKYRPCCDDCGDCCRDCCTCRFNCCCICHAFICRLLPKYNEQHAVCVFLNIFPDLPCKRNGTWCGPIEEDVEDVEYAKNTVQKLQGLGLVIPIVVLVIVVIENVLHISV